MGAIGPGRGGVPGWDSTHGGVAPKARPGCGSSARSEVKGHSWPEGVCPHELSVFMAYECH